MLIPLVVFLKVAAVKRDILGTLVLVYECTLNLTLVKFSGNVRLQITIDLTQM